MNRRSLMAQLAHLSVVGVMILAAAIGTPSCTTSSEGEPAQNGKESSDGGETADGGKDGGDDAGNTGTPCSSAHEGDVCSKENETCGSCTDPCQFCNLLRCSGGRWTGLEAFPTPPTDPQCQKDGGQTDGGTTDGGDDSGAEDSGS